MSQIFAYQDKQVRTFTENNEIWLAAVDVCRALDISWSGRKILRGFPDDWQRVVKLTTLRRGEQETVVISEPAVYKLAFRSNKPEADTFTNWVASEVLPAIRKTGKFEASPRQRPPHKALPTPEQLALPASPAVLDEQAQKVQSLVREVKERGNELMSALFTLESILRFRPAKLDPAVSDFSKALKRNLPSFGTAISMNVSALSELLDVYCSTLAGTSENSSSPALTQPITCPLRAIRMKTRMPSWKKCGASTTRCEMKWGSFLSR